MINGSETNVSTRNDLDSRVVCARVPRTTDAKIGETVALSFILVTSVLGNALVAIVVHKERRMRTTVNFLIVNMALSDLLCTVFVIPRAITETLTYPRAWLVTGFLGKASCKLVYFVQEVTIAVSLLSLLVVAVERYQAITRPLTVCNMHRKRRSAIIAATWLIGSVLNGSQFYTFKIRVRLAGQPQCIHTWEPALDPMKAREIEFLVDTIVFLIVPFILVTALYSIILVKINSKLLPGEKNRMKRQQQQKRNRNVLRMLLAVVLAFGFCWIPVIIYMYMATYIWLKRDFPLPCGFQVYGKWALYLTYLNSAVNPTIYFLFSVNYRKGLMKICRPCFCSFGCMHAHDLCVTGNKNNRRLELQQIGYN